MSLRSSFAALSLVFLTPAVPSAVGRDAVHVYAAASLTDALEEIAAAWEAATGHQVVFNLGASNDLARQIQAGAPADVFFSADKLQMDLLLADGLVKADDRADLLSNTLVVVVPKESAAKVTGPADLLAFRRLALADPEAVPAGVYARQWLVSTGHWAQVKAPVIPALNVRAALAAVESENAEAGIVYKTDATLSKRVRVAYEVPRAEGPAIVYPLALMAASRKPAARAFVLHLRSAPSREVFRRFGFVVLGEK